MCPSGFALQWISTPSIHGEGLTLNSPIFESLSFFYSENSNEDFSDELEIDPGTLFVPQRGILGDYPLGDCHAARVCDFPSHLIAG
jgi:hypothetical protein